MPFRGRRFLSPIVFAAALIALPALAFQPDADQTRLQFPLEYEAQPLTYKDVRVADASPRARAAGLDASWVVQENPRTRTVHVAYGGKTKIATSISSEAQAVSLARDFLLANASVLGVRSDNMQLQYSVQHAGRYAVHYRQVLLGTPVLNATAWVLMSGDGTVAAFGSDFIPDRPGEVPPHASLTSDAAVTLAANSIGATPTPGAALDVSEVYVPAPAGEVLELTIAYKVVFETDEPFGKWETIVHGLTGEILARRNLLHPVNVVGTTEGDVQANPPSLSYCDGSATQVLGNMDVAVSGGNSGVSDRDGNFDISHGGSSPVTVTATLSGPYIDVDRFTGLGADASFSGTFTPGSSGTVFFDGSNSRQDERDTFYHGNFVRNWMDDLDGAWTELDATQTTVGRTDGFCPGNAWWNVGGKNMNYCEAGGSNENTGEMANVVYHEYGHGVTEVIYIDRGGVSYPATNMSEGNSDVVANFIDRNSIIGIGFFTGNCVGGIRDANNSLQYPGDATNNHSGGQVIAGFHWDAWQALLATLPQAEADSVAYNTWHFGRLMGLPTDMPSQVLWTFMTDDDDADLTNGTPHYDQICVGATNHGFSCPTILTGVVIGHTPLGITTDDVNGYDVVATITSTEGGLDPAQLKVIYNVNGGPDQEALMTATGNPDEYSATIPAQTQATEVEYYITASDLMANNRTDPALAPSSKHAFDVAMLYDDLESGPGTWTLGVGSDNATTGFWDLVDPVGTVAQPEDDSTPGAGTTCFITGQCGSGFGTCPSVCDPTNDQGCNDVDGGTVTLLSPVYNLAGMSQAIVKYDRWFSNSTGSSPNLDLWEVDVSNDGGASWTIVESTAVTNQSWVTVSVDINATFGAPNLVQLRFRTSDDVNGSIVEAGVDDVRILASSGAVDAPELPVAAAGAALALEQNQPNPFRPETRIRFALPARADIDLTVYDVQGRTVRQLASGVREAGQYDIAWNGRDTQGHRVAAGVYFYRLTAGENTLTRKMTVLK